MYSRTVTKYEKHFTTLESEPHMRIARVLVTENREPRTFLTKISGIAQSTGIRYLKVSMLMFTVCSQILPTDSDPILILSGYRLATSGITFQSSIIHEMGVEVVRVLLVHRGTSHLLHNRYSQVRYIY